ncbi:MAG TPA: Hsp20/alpha crystallin family protein [Syntrophales bacterium]|nr:Hsp20/alpha crystallin family protein [Syntrophales bacterium]
MESSISNFARQYGAPSVDMGYLERRKRPSAWEKTEQHDPHMAPVTMWIGVSTVIVSLSIPDIDSDDLFEVSVQGNRLSFSGSARNNYFRWEFDLPCAVESTPIYITEGKGTLSALLVRGAQTGTHIGLHLAREHGLSQIEIAGP